MRVTSEFFVAALVRRVFAMGAFAAVERKGAAEAGAIFVRQHLRNGTEMLYGPAPQTMFDEEDSGGRKFELRVQKGTVFDIDAVFEKEKRFDPDFWVVAVEIEDIGDLLDVVE